MSKKILIVDSFSLLFRSYFALSSFPVLNREGQNIGAIQGFFISLFKTIESQEADYVVFAIDSDGKNRRKNLYSQYKANRDSAPEDLKEQIKILKSILLESKFPLYEKSGYEADDIICSLVCCLKNDFDIVIYSQDKDLLQLVDDDNNVSQLRSGGVNATALYKAQDVFKKYGIYPKQMIDYLSLLGDASDNIPGVKGIGEKKASSLLEQYESAEGIYNSLSDISPSISKSLQEGREDFKLSKVLVTLENPDIGRVNKEDLLLKRVDFSHLIESLKKIGCFKVSNIAYELSKKIGMELNLQNNDVKTSQQNAIVYSEKRIEDISLIKDKFLSSKEVPLNINENNIYVFLENSLYILPIINANMTTLENILSQMLGTLIVLDGKKIYRLFPNLHLKKSISDLGIKYWLLNPEESKLNISWAIEKYLNIKPKVNHNSEGRGVDLLELMDEKKSLLNDTLSFDEFCCFNNLSRKLDELLEKDSLMDIYLTLDEKVIRPISLMERKGIFINKSRCIEFENELREKIEGIRSEIFSMNDNCVFNLNSSKQLYEQLVKRGTIKLKKNGKIPSLDAQKLLEIDDPICSLLLEYRKLSKLFSTYTSSLYNLADNNSVIHTTFLQTGTATGRLSSCNPNLQNIPTRSEIGNKIRSFFNPRPGYKFLSADYSQIELRVLASLSCDDNLVEIFKNDGDVHTLTSAAMFSKNPNNITESERRMAKSINFGIIYGMSAHRLSQELQISIFKAQNFLNGYFITFPKVKSWIDETLSVIKERGYSQTLFGERRYFANINSPNKNLRSADERAAINSVVQGTAASIMKLAIINLQNEIEENKLKSFIVLTIHDELIVEVEKSEEEMVKKLVNKAFIDDVEKRIELKVPLKIGMSIADNWGEL